MVLYIINYLLVTDDSEAILSQQHPIISIGGDMVLAS
jgi:hypothetical protein